MRFELCHYRRSDRVDNGVDIDVNVYDDNGKCIVTGEITVVELGSYDGPQYGAWGSVHNWASDELVELGTDALNEIEVMIDQGLCEAALEADD